MSATGRYVPRLSLTREEAADSLGMSVDSFERYVLPHVKVVRLGRIRAYPVKELERFLEEQAEPVLGRSGGAEGRAGL